MPALGQASSSEPSQIQEFSRPTSTIQTTRNEEFRGSQYFNDDWQKGYVIFNSGQKSKTVDLKYSTYGNELLFKKNGTLLAVTPHTYQAFVLMLNGEPLTFKKGYSSRKYDISKGQLLQAVYDGKVKFLIHHQNRLRHGNRPDPLTGKVTNRFRTDEYYYLVDANGTWQQVEMDQDDILEALGQNQQQLASFAKSNNLDFDNPNDLNKILTKYDNMMNKQK